MRNEPIELDGRGSLNDVKELTEFQNSDGLA